MKRLDPQYITHQIGALLDRYPELREDEELRLDVLEGETDTLKLLEYLVRRKAEAESHDEGIALYIKELGVRRARMQRRSEVARELMFKILEAADLKKVELPEATLSIKAGPAKVVITDEIALPEQFVKVERTPKKKEISDAIKRGEHIAGALLSNGEPTLTVRMG